jgi:hypothetical protein
LGHYTPNLDRHLRRHGLLNEKTGWVRSNEAINILGLGLVGAVIAIAAYIVLAQFSANHTVYQSPSITSLTTRFVSEPFVVSGGGNVVVEVASNMDNSYLDLEIRLVDNYRKVAYLTNQDVEFYHGYEGGEHWTEGSKSDEIYFSRIPAGTYVLEVLPVSDANQGRYQVNVVRDRMRLAYLVGVLIWFGFWVIFIAVGRSDGR